jgi:hypothetical protein
MWLDGSWLASVGAVGMLKHQYNGYTGVYCCQRVKVI